LALHPDNPDPNADPWRLDSIVYHETQRIDSNGAPPVLNGDKSRMFVATRQQNVLFSFDLDAPDPRVASGVRLLYCGDKGRTRFTSCSDDYVHQLTGAAFSDTGQPNDTAQPFVGTVTAPYPGLPGEYLFLTHLNAGAISVYDITPNALTNKPGFAAVSLLGADRLGAIVNGTSAIAVASSPGRVPTVYAGSSRVISVRPPGASSTLFFFDPRAATDPNAVTGVISLAQYFGGTGASIDVKAIATSPDGTRTYFLTREPNALSVLDSSIDPSSGLPRNLFLDVVPLERQPGTIVYVPMPDGRDLLYLTCFGDGSILVFDARTHVLVNKIGTHNLVNTPPDDHDLPNLERGPYSLATTTVNGQVLVLATYFNDDALLIFDARTGLAVARVGTPHEYKK
jgi:hypothetical protein